MQGETLLALMPGASFFSNLKETNLFRIPVDGGDKNAPTNARDCLAAIPLIIYGLFVTLREISKTTNEKIFISRINFDICVILCCRPDERYAHPITGRNAGASTVRY